MSHPKSDYVDYVCDVYKHSCSVNHFKVVLSPNECVPTHIKDSKHQKHGS